MLEKPKKKIYINFFSFEKASNDSNMSCSRLDSSTTSTNRISRSSFSSDSSSKQTTTSSLSSSGAGPSGLHKQDLTNKSKTLNRFVSSDKPQLYRQTAIEDKRQQQKSPPSRMDSTGYLCHNCAQKDLSKQQNINSPKNMKFKNKELEEKFNYFYSRLAEMSQEESSECRDHNIVSLDHSTGGENKLDLSTQSRDTAETSLQDSISSHGIV